MCAITHTTSSSNNDGQLEVNTLFIHLGQHPDTALLAVEVEGWTRRLDGGDDGLGNKHVTMDTEDRTGRDQSCRHRRGGIVTSMHEQEDRHG